jgi:AraC-like DNA-binding protein
VCGRLAGATCGHPARQARYSRTHGDTWYTQPAASWPFTPCAARRSFPLTGRPGPPPGSPTTTAPTATPTCGSSFSPPSLARLIPGHPAVFLASGLAREVLLALTGPRNYDDAAPDYSRSARSRLLRVLVDELREAHEQPLHLPEPRDDRLQAIARMLYEKPADKASLAELGKTIGASTRTLSRLFRNELGMTFYEWRTQLRVYHALVLLSDGHDTTQTAYACGWANPSSFIAAFTNIIGTTPGRYRTGHQNAGPAPGIAPSTLADTANGADLGPARSYGMDTGTRLAADG